MTDFRLMFITDRTQCRSGSLAEVVSAAFSAGLRVVQVREKDLPSRALLDLAFELRGIASEFHGRVLVNDRPDVALAASLDGVHCPEDGFPVGDARRLLGEHTLIGRSVHSVQAALEAERDGADYVVFGSVFATPSKAAYGPPQGLDALHEVASRISIPILAVGGVRPENAASCVEAGAFGVAAIAAVASAEDVEGALDAFRRTLGSL